jgi:Fe-S cluster biosynthesis and repair protein YggX
LGKKIYDNVSQQAWGQWMEHCKMLLNEYRLNPARKQDQEVIVKQMEQFFFGEGASVPLNTFLQRTECLITFASSRCRPSAARRALLSARLLMGYL